VALVGALSGFAEAEFLLGDWVAARETYARAAREGSALDAAWYLGFVQLGLADVEIAEGRWSEAEAQLASCLIDGPRLGHHNRREHALRLLARRDLLADAPADALARLEEVVRVEGDEHPGTLALRAWAFSQSGDADLAGETVASAVRIASYQGNRLDLCEALFVRGEVDLGTGELERAAAALDDALRLSQAMPYPYAEARVRYARARVLLECGDVRNAVEQLAIAIGMLQRLGARPYLDKAERLRATLAARGLGA
jgi:tetratricopeptide (TPR) repeat protein